MIKAPAYPPGITLARIISEGWMRGFEVEQTVDEAISCGFDITRQEVLSAWEDRTKEYIRYLESRNYD